MASIITIVLALYREPVPSPLSGLTSLPGGAWLSVGLVLAGLRDSVRLVAGPTQAAKAVERSTRSPRKNRPTGVVLPAPPPP
jgi:hypothetical protein